MKMAILSHYQARAALETQHNHMDSVSISLDLGLSSTLLRKNQLGLQLPDGTILTWEDINKIAESTSSCFVLKDGLLNAVQFYSKMTERAYSLYPTTGAPTMLVSGIPMHRIKGTEPHQDTMEKIRSIKPVVGQVLDTATGLGYTAIEAARTAEHVTTIELDRAALDVCKQNPWSQELFNNPKITQVIGDSFDVVADMEAERFTRVIHDPPAFSLAGDLYSGEFYRQLYRVMRNRSKLFHYVGDPESKSGSHITASVVRRLELAGFSQVRRTPRAFGVVAVKEI